MQLDCFELKTKFLTLNKTSGSFTGIANKMFSKCENLLKVISSPPDTIKETYAALIENPNESDLEKIMGLIVFKKLESEGKGKMGRIGK